MDIPDSFILHKEKFPTVILECDAILHILSHKNNLTALSLAIYTWLAYTNCPLSLEEISIALNQSNLDVAAAIKNLKSLELI